MSKLPYVLGGAALVGLGYLLYKKSLVAQALPPPADAPKAGGGALPVLSDAEKVSLWQFYSRATFTPTSASGGNEISPRTAPPAANINLSLDAYIALMNQAAYVLKGQSSVSGDTVLRFSPSNEDVPKGFTIFLLPGEWKRVQGLAGVGYQISALPPLPGVANNTGLPSIPIPQNTVPGWSLPIPGLGKASTTG